MLRSHSQYGNFTAAAITKLHMPNTMACQRALGSAYNRRQMAVIDAQGCYAAVSWSELNPRPIDHKSNALPLSHCAT